MARDLSSARCANHPERPGAALCMSCKRVACHECATRHEGILYCARCLADRAAPATSRTDTLGWVTLGTALLILLGLLPWTIACSGTTLASWG